MITYLKGLGASRRWTHVGLAAASILAVLATMLYQPGDSWVEHLTLGLGYISLIYLAATLLVGPIKLVSQSRNPVNINLRRDVGIWAGITGLLHVLFGFQVHMRGDIIQYFFQRNPNHPEQLSLQNNLFGLSNSIGLIATLILLVLLILSNDISLKWLRGPRWKWIQRSNYILTPLVIAHTLGYQQIMERERTFLYAVILVTILLFAGQFIGIWVTRRRQT